MNVFIGVGTSLALIAVVVPCGFLIDHCLSVKARDRALSQRELNDREKEIKENTIIRTVKKKTKKRAISKLRNKRKERDRDRLRDSIHSTLSLDTNVSGSANSCHICLEEFKPGDIVCSSKNETCRHMFHEDCITVWLLNRNRNDCPVCRNEFLIKQEIKEEEKPLANADVDVEANVASNI